MLVSDKCIVIKFVLLTNFLSVRPVRQSHGHEDSCFFRGHLTLGEVGFGETMGQCRVGPCLSSNLVFAFKSIFFKVATKGLVCSPLHCFINISIL